VTITATPSPSSSSAGSSSSSGTITTSCKATVPTGSPGTTQSCSYQLYYLSYDVGYNITASASGYTPVSVTFGPTSSSTNTLDFKLSS
jgi:hypothetical protein